MTACLVIALTRHCISFYLDSTQLLRYRQVVSSLDAHDTIQRQTPLRVYSIRREVRIGSVRSSKNESSMDIADMCAYVMDSKPSEVVAEQSTSVINHSEPSKSEQSSTEELSAVEKRSTVVGVQMLPRTEGR